ncbi:MAG: tyrosine-type recombinase/integrase [Nitrososphaerota archaeon]
MRREKYLKRLLEDGFRSQKNRAIFKLFFGVLKSQGLKITSIAHYGRALELLDEFTEGKPFNEVSREDLERFFVWLAERYEISRVDNIKICIKRFYRWFLGKDEKYPEIVSWIKKTNHKNNLHPSNLLTEDEFRKMLTCCESFRDRAILMILWETGVRVGELASLKVKDVEMRGDMALISVSGKTGVRKLPVILAFPDLMMWLRNHPNPKPDNPLFVRVRGRKLEPLLESGIEHVVKKIARKAGIEKRIYPHLLRHSRATQLAQRLREPILRQFFGWSPGSRTPQIYIHLSAADLVNNYRELLGFEKIEKIEDRQKPKKCVRCEMLNSFDADTCIRCGYPLDPSKIIDHGSGDLDELKVRLEILERVYRRDRALHLILEYRKMFHVLALKLGPEINRAKNMNELFDLAARIMGMEFVERMKRVESELRRLRLFFNKSEWENIEREADYFEDIYTKRLF